MVTKEVGLIKLGTCKANRGHALRQGKILFVSWKIVYLMTCIAK